MPNGIQLSGGVLVGAQAALDVKYGPYNSTTDALNDISSGYRYRGLTIGILSGTSIVEYWFKDGITNSDFVIKNVVSVASKTGDVTLTKSDVGLSNVDNTSDANKPVSSATQTALNAKENTIAAGTTAQYWRGDKSWQTLDKSAVGLSNVDNTSDANKPVSTATQTALNAKVNTSSLGTASGVATLDANSKLTSSQIPDIAISEYLGAVASEAAMLALTGQKGDWVNRTDTGTVFIITGTTPSLIGSWTQLNYPTAPVTSVAGKTGAVTLAKGDVGLGNVENTALSTWAGSSNITTVGTVTGTSFNSITGLSSTTPAINGSPSVGSSTTVARADHVHPTDTTRASTSQTMHIGTTQVAINRASGSLALTGITSIDGNAATATKLQTARNINGVSFDGSGDITISTADATKLPLAGGTMTGAITFAAGQTWPTFNQSTTGNAATATVLQTGRTLTIGSTGKSFDGSAAISWSLSEIGAQPAFTLANSTTVNSGLTGSLSLSLTNNVLSLTGTLSSDLKTVNGQSLLGSGDLTISTLGSLTVSPNVGLTLASGNLSTLYNTTMSDTVQSTSVGGASPAAASTWKTRTLVQVLDAILFPDVAPTYTIPTLTLSATQTSTPKEVGDPISQSLTLVGTKNDAGAFTSLALVRTITNTGGSPAASSIGSTATPTTVTTTNVADQFGYANPNSPNMTYSFVQTDAGYTTVAEGLTVWSATSAYSAGLAKQNNKGVTDPRTAAVRSTSAPQAASTNLTPSTVSITGIYPYYWGVSSTQPTTATIAAAISGGTATRVLSSSTGTVSVTFNASGQYIWFAHAGIYAEKTKWYNTELNQGNIGAGNFILAPVSQNMTANNGFWTGVSFKVYISQGATTTSGSIQFRNS